MQYLFISMIRVASLSRSTHYVNKSVLNKQIGVILVQTTTIRNAQITNVYIMSENPGNNIISIYDVDDCPTPSVVINERYGHSTKHKYTQI